MGKPAAGIGLVAFSAIGMFIAVTGASIWNDNPGQFFPAIDSPEETGQALISYGWRSALIVAMTLGGILSKNIYDQISGITDQPVSILKVLASLYQQGRLWISVIVCPLVVLGFYDSVVQMKSMTLLALFCYQNGFFFESIINGLAEKKDRSGETR
jgi:hypothetical protein